MSLSREPFARIDGTWDQSRRACVRKRRMREIQQLESLGLLPFPVHAITIHDTGTGLQCVFGIIVSVDEGQTMYAVDNIRIFMPYDTHTMPTAVIPVEWFRAHPTARYINESELSTNERRELNMCDWSPAANVLDALAAVYVFLVSTL
jgi:hypothetical protein